MRPAFLLSEMRTVATSILQSALKLVSYSGKNNTWCDLSPMYSASSSRVP